MAADILLYDANLVPVGKDQMQHLEMTRDIATAFNNKVGKELLVVPEGLVDERVMIVPGTDGQKMSKSYNNFINIFLPEKDLKKVVMAIVTDSTPLEAPKNPDTCNAFKLFQLLASKEQTETMRQNYLKGNYGYGHAKTALFELILEKYSEQRRIFTELMNHPTKLEEELSIGEAKAKKMAQQKLSEIRKALGFA
jgi:tryptophanyl-tRNA synthetase